MAAIDTRPQDGAVPVVLVTITSRVGVYRLASEPVEVAWSGGNGPLQFHAGLRGVRDMEAEVDLFALESRGSFQSARIRAVLPNGVNAAASEHLFHGLSAAVVEVALWWPGQDYGARLIVADGAEVTGLSLGRADEETEFYVETVGPPVGAAAVRADRDLGAIYPKGAGAFPDLSGRQFPYVVGRVYGVPVYRVGTNQVGGRHSGILAGHHLAPSVAISDLAFWEGNEGGHPFDGAGGLTWPESGTTLSLTSPTLNNGVASDGLPVSWVETDITQLTSSLDPVTVDFKDGGVPAVRDTSRAALGLGEALEWLLCNSGVDVDLHAQRRCTALLAGWEGGVYLDRYDDLLSVIRQRIAPFLPIVEDRTSRGVYFRFADPRVAPVEFTVTLGQELIGPVGPVVLTDLRAVRNSFFLEYGYMHSSGRYAGTLSYGAADLESCRYSQQVYGERADKSLRCTITWDQATARRILQTRAERLALPRRLLTYLVDPSAVALREGQVGVLTDTDRGLSAQRVTLRSWRPAGGPWRAVFETVERAPVSRL